MRRKNTAILLAIGLSVTAVLSTACGNSGASSTAAEDKPAAEETAQDQQAEEAPEAEQPEKEPAAEAEQPAKEDAAEAEKPANEEIGTAQAQTEQPLAAAGGQITAVKPASDQFHCELEEAGSFAYDRSYRVTYDSIVHAESDYYTFCGADGKWMPAKIVNLIESKDRKGKPQFNGPVKGKELIVVADGVAEPKKLRYLYSSPWFGSVYSDACLPLGAFHIGD